MKAFLLTASTIAISITVCGQATNNDYRAVVNPPTIPSDEITVADPEAATLNKYVDMPVNHAFGTMDISIPLFQWQCGSISCGVSISYSTGAVRHDDVKLQYEKRTYDPYLQI